MAMFAAKGFICHTALTPTARHPCREVAERYRGVWGRDRVGNLVVRLRQNVLRAGLARMGAAYSRISLADVASKLGVGSAADAESIVAKVVRCGGQRPRTEHVSRDEVMRQFSAQACLCADPVPT